MNEEDFGNYAVDALKKLFMIWTFENKSGIYTDNMLEGNVNIIYITILLWNSI